MTDDVRRASIDAIARSGRVLAEARQEQARIHRTLERSRRLDRERERQLSNRVRRWLRDR